MADQRQPALVPWYQRAGVWIGIATSPGALVVGGGLAAHLSGPVLLLAIPFGAFLLTALTVANGVISRRRREILVERAIFTFGPGFGAGLVNLVMVLSTIGWISFYLGIGGLSLATLLQWPGWLGVLIILGSSLILNELGLNRWNALVWVTTISALGAAIVALTVVEPRPVPLPNGDLGLFDLLWGIGTVLSYSLVFAVRCGDFTWDLERDRDVVKDGWAYFLPVLVLLGIGVALYRLTGNWNLADVLAQTPSASLGHIFLILAVVAPILTNFHSGILALVGLVPLKRRPGALIIAAVGFVLGATRFDRRLLPFLDLLGTVLLPLLVVMLAGAILPQKPSFRTALIAWLAGSGAALLFKLQGQLIHLFVGAAISLIVLYAMSYWARKSYDLVKASDRTDA